MAWTRISSPNEWDDALLQRGMAPHALQRWAWGEFKSRWGWSASRWVLREGGDIRAAVQLLRRAAGPMCVLYAPKGPVVADPSATGEALDFLQSQARSQRAFWLKIDGDHAFERAEGWRDRAAQVLRGRNWRLSGSQVQFRNTCLTDIARTDDDLLAAMKQKWRYNVRLAEKRGVTVRLAGPADESLLYQMYAETGARDGFLIRTQPYYADAWRSMNATGFIAEREGRPLAAVVLFTYGKLAWYFYGMSRTEGREHMPTYAVQWYAMRWARDQGCDTYDWWGAPERPDDETDSMAGVYRFKLGFDAHFHEGLGAWDYAPSRFLYTAYTGLMPKVLGIIRGRRTQTTES